MSTKRFVFLGLILSILIGTLSAREAGADEKEWMTSVEAAFSQAEEKGQEILVDLYADWCLACRALQTEVFPTEVVQKRIKDLVLLRVDVMDQGEGTDLMARYGVQKLPNTLVLAPDGIRLASVQGFMGPEELVSTIDDHIAKYDRQSANIDKVLAAGEKPALQERIARDFHERLDGTHAARIYEKMLEAENVAPEDRGRLLYFLADAYRLAGDFDRAEKRGREARAAIGSDDPALDARVDLLGYYIARNAGACDKAETLLESFIETHRDTAYARDARRFLRDLRRGDRNGCLDAATASL